MLPKVGSRLSRRIRRYESANLPWSWARRQTAYARFYRHEGIMISTLFASSKFVTNRNDFQVIAETGPPASFTTTAWQMAAICSIQKTRTNWTFRNLQCSLCPRVNHLNDMEYNHNLAPYPSALIRVSSHLYIDSNELCSPGERPEFRFPNGL